VDALSVTAAAGFKAGGVACGIKPDARLDLALLTAAEGTVGAAVFTTNRAAAAPVTVGRRSLARGPSVRAVILNSGCANAGTGAEGIAAAETTVETVAAAVGCATDEVLVCSTGGIGKPLEVSKIVAGVGALMPQLSANSAAGTAAAEAIMTTDTVSKEALIRGGGFTVGGMAKGAGMVRPDMATMLVVVTTDAAVEPGVLDDSLRAAVDETFHALNIDGCPSTNDTVILLASGSSGFNPTPAQLAAAVTEACRDLAYQLAADAEGASRVVTLEVVGGADPATARRAGRLVTDSALVRSAFFGGDPNWGRLLGALGATDIEFDPDEFGVAYAGIAIAQDGREVAHDADALHRAIAEGDFTVTMTIGRGPGSARVLTTDLTPDYVAFNAEYS
jgi:glutamate N-acetyltransferase/amino-acid N-acetyltransferase